MKKLMISIHDVTPVHRPLIAEIVAMLDQIGLAGQYSMLVVPNYWERGEITEDLEFCDWLKKLSAAGVEMVLHGLTHRDDAHHESVSEKFQARVFTAREGEFLGLDQSTANARIRHGQEIFHTALGYDADTFIAPAWLYSHGTKAALTNRKFKTAENHWTVWSPVTGAVLVSAPVISYASRSRMRLWSSIIWSRLATLLAGTMPVVRLAIHPMDFTSQTLVTEIKRAIAALRRDRSICLYRDLLAQNR